MEFLSVNYVDLHESITNSPVYNQLIEDNDSINIDPKYCFKNFDNLSENNFCIILNALRFWGIEFLPYEVLLFVAENSDYLKYMYNENFKKDVFNGSIVQYFKEIDLIFEYDSLFDSENESDNEADHKSENSDESYDFFDKVYDFSLEAAKIGSINLLKIVKAYHFFWDMNTPYQAKKNGHEKCFIYAIQNGCQWNQQKFILQKLNILGPKYHSFYGIDYGYDEDMKIEIEHNSVKIMFEGSTIDNWYNMPSSDWYNKNNFNPYNNGKGLPTLDTRPYISVKYRYMEVHISAKDKESLITLDDILFASRALCGDWTRVIDQYKIISDDNSTLVLVPKIDNFST
jgi:hypothetical protein